MEYIYYKAKQGNFGDDLNGWLWPKFFGESNRSDDYFIGIGSILFNSSSLLKTLSHKRKIVFGSGVRPDYKPFVHDKTWSFKFLRGPLSAGALDNEYEYISDGAYAVRLIKEFEQLKNTDKKYEVSLMPYFHSVGYFNWEKICNKLGYHYISPLSEYGVEHTLKEIASSKNIISEAMHGAILADALRVPWSRFILTTPYTEGQIISEFKWMDWLYSIEVLIDKPTHIKFYRNSFANKWIKTITNHTIDAKFLLKKMVKKEIIEQLSSVKNYYLSKDLKLKSIDERIENKINELYNDNKNANP